MEEDVALGRAASMINTRRGSKRFEDVATRTSMRSPVCRVLDTEVAWLCPSALVRISTRTRVFDPSPRMMLHTPADASEVPVALASPETEIPPVSDTLIFSTVSAFALGEVRAKASAIEMRSTFFIVHNPKKCLTFDANDSVICVVCRRRK